MIIMKKIIYFLVITFGVVSCGEDLFNLDVPNTRNPGTAETLADPSSYPGIIAGSFRTWYLETASLSVGSWAQKPARFATNSDSYVGTGAEYTYYVTGEKPRIPNSEIGGFHEGIWYGHYAGLGPVRDVLMMVDAEGKQYRVSGKDMTHVIQANACFLLGAYYADIALLFDKAFILTEHTDIEGITSNDLADAVEVRDAALAYFDRCIAICTENTFTNLSGLFPGNVLFANNDELKQFANFLAARLLASFPRYSDETSSVDWTRVKNYVQNGITKDWMITLPEQGWGDMTLPNWAYYDELNTRSIWYRVNHRVLNMMATDKSKVPWPTPSTWTNANILTETATSADERFFNSDPNDLSNDPIRSDFIFLDRLSSNDINFQGRNNYSQYAINRFCDVGISPVDHGDLYWYLKAESDLLYAEALIRSNGDKTLAANLINNTRVDRGNLSPALSSESNDDLLKKMFYEKFVECSWTVATTPFYDRRRNEFNEFKLTLGSFRELPVPFRELDIWKIVDSYDNKKPSFGGPEATKDNIQF